MSFEGLNLPTRVHIPHFDGMVIAGADEHLSVWGNHEAPNPLRVPLDGSDFLQIRHVEIFDRGISSAGDQLLTILREGNGAYPVFHGFLESAMIIDKESALFGFFIIGFVTPVSIADGFFLATREDFVQFQFANVTPSNEVNAIRRKRRTDRPVVVILIFSQKGHQFGARRDLPNFDILVLARASQHEAIRRKRNAAHGMIVACKEQPRGFAGLWIPESNRAIFAGGCQNASIWAEGDLPDIMRMAPEGPDEASRFYFPETEIPITAPAGQGLSIR